MSTLIFFFVEFVAQSAALRNQCMLEKDAMEDLAASAGTLISVFGAKRFIRPNAYMLIHQLSSGFWGKMSEIEDEYKNLAELMERLLNIYKENTKIPKKELHDLLRHDLWLNSDKSLKYGLVDEIYK